MWAKLNTVKFSAPPKDPDTDIELPPEAPVSIDNEPQPEPSASHKASLQKLHGYQEDEIEALEWWGKLPEPQKDELASGGRDTVVDAWRAQKDDTPGEEEESDSEISVDKAECDELFDMEDPAIQKLLDQVQATNTIRGKVAEIGRDFSFAMDAVTLSILGVSLAAPPAAAAAPFTAGAARVGSAVAVAADLLNGEWKQAAMDSFGLIPFGGAAGKTGKTAATKTTEKLAAQAAAKAGKEAAAEAAAQGAKKAAIETAAKAASKSAKAVVQTIQKAGAAVTGGIAKAEGAIAGKLVKMGVEEGLSQTLAKTIIHSSKMKLQHKIDSMLGDAPQPSAYETDEEYKGALRKYYDERKATSAQVYASCFADTDSEITKSVKGFLDEIHDWVDELPRWLGTAIEWGMDTYDSFTGKDEPEEAVAEDWGEYAGREVVQEQLDRWQTLAGINKRIL